MKKAFILLSCLLLFPVLSHSQIKSGIVIGGMDSWMHKREVRSGESPYGEKDENWKHRFGFSIGYQFQFDLPKRFFVDAALLYQARNLNVAYTESFGETYENTKLFNSMALNGVVGYRLWKGLKIGAGIEPTLYFNTDMGYNLATNKFDIPVVAKLGYDFNCFQVDLSYKNGFKTIYRNYVVGKPQTRDLQVSIFIPIFK